MKYLIMGCLLLLLSQASVAQQEITLQLMNSLHQSAYTNPAFIPRNKASLTLLSSYYLDAKNTGFSYNRLLSQVRVNEAGARVLNLETMLGQMKLHTQQYLNAGLAIDVFATHFTAGKNRFSINLTEKIQGRVYYDDALLQLLAYGNVPGKSFRFDQYAMAALHYRELGLGYNRKLLPDGRLVLGARFKTLLGMANIQTQYATLTVETATEADLYKLTARTNILLHTSGLSLLKEDNTKAYLTNTGNIGFGADIGATYRLDTKFSFAASLVNAGFIRWRKEVESYHSQGAFEFAGFNSDSLLLTGKLNVDIHQLTDSVRRIFAFQESNRAYSTGLPAKLYLTTFYQVSLQTTAAAIFYADFIGPAAFRRGAALGIRHNIGRWLQASATYSVQARTYTNLGLGLSLSSGTKGLQWYMVSDNVLGLIDVGNTRLTNLRTGFTLIF